MRGANLPQDPECVGGGICELRRFGQAIGIIELRQDQRIDPLGVGSPLDPLRQFGTDVLDQRVAHPGELPEMPVVGERDPRAGELERVQVGVGDDRLARVGHASHVSDQARRGQLGRDESQVRSNDGSAVAR